MSHNVDPTIMNHFRGRAGVGSDNVEHTHHVPNARREEEPEELEKPTKPYGVVGRIRKLALDATGLRSPEENV